jgi:hypothetical protein
MTIVISEVIKITKRQPVSVSEMLIEEFMEPPAVLPKGSWPKRIARVERARPIQEVTAWGGEYMQNLHLQIHPDFIPMMSLFVIIQKSKIALNL